MDIFNDNSDKNRPILMFSQVILPKSDTFLVLNELQKAPDLLPYIQGIVDDPDNDREFVKSSLNNS